MARKRPQVPGGQVPAAAPGQQRPKMLFQSGESAQKSDELQALAQAVASSGLSGSGLRASAAGPVPVAAKALPDKRTIRLLVTLSACIGAIVVLTVVAVWLAVRTVTVVPGERGRPTGAAPPGQAMPSPQVEVSQPHTVRPPAPPRASLVVPDKPEFMGVPLAGPSVVYVLDRGQGTGDSFFAITGGVMRSLASLKPHNKFQIIFWETDSMVEIPPGSLAYATPDRVAETRKALTDVFATGVSRVDRAMAKAVAQNPAEIVIASGKYGLDEEFVKTVLEDVRGRSIKIHTLCLGEGGSPEALKSVAEKTGGKYRLIAGDDLREFGDWTP